MRVLLVDKNGMYREALTIALGGVLDNPEILQVASSAEVLSLLDEGNQFDLVLLAQDQGQNLGLDVLKEFRERLPDAHFIVLSASKNMDALRVAIAGEVDGYILKGASIDFLRQAIRLVESDGMYTVVPTDIVKLMLADNGTDRRPGGRAGFTDLTKRQREVLELLEVGCSNKQIARQLGLLEGTVKVHIRDIMRKLGAKNRTQAAILATTRHRD